MRQRVFGRKSLAFRRGLLGELFRHGKIKTTKARAKSIQGLVERMVKKSAQKSAERKSGFTRIINLGRRKGDAAPLSILELIKPEEKNEN